MIDKSARELARNPLGIIALFIVLVYGIAALALGLTSTLSQEDRTPIVWFLVSFPILVLAAFCWLVSRHHQKLYAPSDYKTDDGFLSAAQIQKRHVEELQAQQDQVQATIREKLERTKLHDQNVTVLIEELEQQLHELTSITIDRSQLTGRPGDRKDYPIGAFPTLDALTNEIYFSLGHRVRPFEYGHSWVLRNTRTGELIRTTRMLTNTPPGVPLSDVRALHEVGIQPGDKLLVERPEHAD